MKKYAILTTLLALILVLLATSACKPAKPAGLATAQVSGVTENALKALDAGDFQKFSRDFSDKMKSAFDQAQFDSLKATLAKASGSFVSLGVPTLTDNQGYAVYRFPAKYEKETVYVTVTFLVGGQKLEGLWLDSMALRKASQ